MTTLLAALALAQAPAHNTLTSEEARAGWKLLFDGKSIESWTGFKNAPIGAGWKVKDGVMVIENPAQAGDIVTKEKYRWFELVLDFNFQPGQNSGIMYWVGDTGGATWQTGPEIQIYDHPEQGGVETTGYLYQLWKPTMPVKDIVKPAGEWNQFRIRVSSSGSFTVMNGKELYRYDVRGEEFKDRIRKSKFKGYADFGQLGNGRIGIQGDHGKVMFRNIKIRSLRS